MIIYQFQLRPLFWMGGDGQTDFNLGIVSIIIQFVFIYKLTSLI